MLGLDSEQISEVWPKLLLVVTELSDEVGEYYRNNFSPFSRPRQYFYHTMEAVSITSF